MDRTRAQRFSKAKLRAKRISRLAKVDGAARKLHTTGAYPGLVYGAEVTGAPAAVVKEARATMATFWGFKHASMGHLRCLHAHQGGLWQDGMHATQAVL